jgi:hypothetical protein
MVAWCSGRRSAYEPTALAGAATGSNRHVKPVAGSDTILGRNFEADVLDLLSRNEAYLR